MNDVLGIRVVKILREYKSTKWIGEARSWLVDAVTVNGTIHTYLHREDGPALVYKTGEEFHYLFGKGIDEADFPYVVAKLKAQRLANK